MNKSVVILILIFYSFEIRALFENKPNIIVIIADDLGRNDVSFNNNKEFIITPNIDALAFYGIVLNRFHSHAMCTPSRGAFLTGKYCIHTGLQHGVIANDEPWGMSLKEKTLPQYLKKVGYQTHLVGKWHLGMSKQDYNPIQRGFDTFYGYLGGYITYYNHDLWMINHPFWPSGHDMRYNETVDRSMQGIHSTDIFTKKSLEIIEHHNTMNPLFLVINHLAPHSEGFFIPFPSSEEQKRFPHINNPFRKRLAVEISRMDSSIGKVIAALDKKNMLSNSVVIFMSDNGAPTLGLFYTFGSNYPLKGQKNSPWEGATRVPAVIWSPFLKKRQYLSNHMIHMVDIPVTLAKLAGIDMTLAGVDGVDFWNHISLNLPKDARTSIIHNIDDYISYTKGDWKYVKKSTNFGIFDWWISDILQNDGSINNPYTTHYYDLVRNSSVGVTLKKYADGKPISDIKMQYIRDRATINCSQRFIPCLPYFYPCLFNLRKDPCEYENLYFILADKAKEMENEIDLIKKSVVSRRNKAPDKRSNPKYFQKNWSWWEDL